MHPAYIFVAALAFAAGCIVLWLRHHTVFCAVVLACVAAAVGSVLADVTQPAPDVLPHASQSERNAAVHQSLVHTQGGMKP